MFNPSRIQRSPRVIASFTLALALTSYGVSAQGQNVRRGATISGGRFDTSVKISGFTEVIPQKQ